MVPAFLRERLSPSPKPALSGGVVDELLRSVRPYRRRMTESELDTYAQHGYVVLDCISPPAEVAAMREIYDRLFGDFHGWDRGDLFDLVGSDEEKGKLRLPQMFWLSKYVPALRATNFFANAEAIAQQILGAGVSLEFEHAILKPAHDGIETPWHQDDAYNRTSSGYDTSISVWMPLQDATLENGCLHYVPGSHLGALRKHQSVGNDPRVHALETLDIDRSEGVPCPVPAGGTVIHHSRILHYAGPNRSPGPRRAHVLGYAKRGRSIERNHEWQAKIETARDRRRIESAPTLKRTVLKALRLLEGYRK